MAAAGASVNAADVRIVSVMESAARRGRGALRALLGTSIAIVSEIRSVTCHAPQATSVQCWYLLFAGAYCDSPWLCVVLLPRVSLRLYYLASRCTRKHAPVRPRWVGRGVGHDSPLYFPPPVCLFTAVSAYAQDTGSCRGPDKPVVPRGPFFETRQSGLSSARDYQVCLVSVVWMSV